MGEVCKYYGFSAVAFPGINCRTLRGIDGLAVGRVSLHGTRVLESQESFGMHE